MEVKDQVDDWLQHRALQDLLSYEGVDDVNANILRYKFKRAGTGAEATWSAQGEKPTTVYHGTWWYALRTAFVVHELVLCDFKKHLRLAGSCVVGDT